MKKWLYSLLLLSTGIFHGNEGKTQDLNLYERQLFIQGNDTLPCRILSPMDFSMDKKYPLLVFLHGSGERGNNNEAQLTWGAGLFLDSANRSKFPAIIVFPQCPKDSSWSAVDRKQEADSLGNFAFPMDRPATGPLQMVMNFIDTLVKNGRADPKRIYMGGLSMGGFGTFEILWRRPKLFAAAFPICGGGNPDAVKLYAKKFPIWVFHGAIDAVVPVSNSRLMVRVLRNAGAEVKYSEYPGVNHNSWTNAFAEPELLSWIFSQKRK
jgi:predicted peptidase